MNRPPLHRTVPAILLAGLLVLLAALQFRWIGEISQAQSERLLDSIETVARRAGNQLTEEISILAFSIAPATEATMGDLLDRWRTGSNDPDLVARVVEIQIQVPQPGERLSVRERFALRQFDEGSGRFVPLEWSQEIRPLARTLTRRRGDRLREGLAEFEPTLPAILLHVDRIPWRERGFPRGERRGTERRTVLAIVLDRNVLQALATEQVLRPVQERLGDDFVLRLVDQAGRTISSNVAEWPNHAEVGRFDLMRLRPPELLRQAALERVIDRHRQSGLPDPPWAERFARRGGLPDEAVNAPRTPGLWVLEISHRSGDLEAAVARLRTRNLLISAAILALLAGTVAYLLRSASRERALAQQQLDFVAGLTHELHTPLAAIGSAGANLADGVVTDETKVRQYGRMLRREGTRLEELVSQALLLAGVESSGGRTREPLDARELIESAVRRTELIADEAGASLIQRVEADAQLEGDRETLARALTNLLSNALKAGAQTVEIAANISEPGWLNISVSDDGSGIEPEDRDRIFEPYVRGQNATGSGTGLGLYLVRRIAGEHGGTLRLDSAKSRLGGARFVLALPVAATEPALGSQSAATSVADPKEAPST